MGVQACRLPYFILQPTGTPRPLINSFFWAPKPAVCQPLKSLKRLKTLTTRHGGPSLPFAMLHPAANRHPKATHQCLLMGVQACRLPALKPLKPLQPVMGVQACRLPCFILHPTGTPRPLINSFFWAPLTTRHGGPSLPFAMLHPTANRHPNGHTSMPSYGRPSLWGSKPAVCHASSYSQQAPNGRTSIASYGRPSLPFASP